MTSNKCLKYSHPTKPSMCGRFDLKPLFLGKFRPERLTSNQMVCQQRTSFAWSHKQSIYFFRPQWAGAQNKNLTQISVCNDNKILNFEFIVFH